MPSEREIRRRMRDEGCDEQQIEDVVDRMADDYVCEQKDHEVEEEVNG